jgi:hypothetical protein
MYPLVRAGDRSRYQTIVETRHGISEHTHGVIEQGIRFEHDGRFSETPLLLACASFSC